MKREVIAEHLQRSILFKDATVAEIASFAQVARVEIIPEGEYVYQKGDASEVFYVIAMGEAELILGRDDGGDALGLIEGETAVQVRPRGELAGGGLADRREFEKGVQYAFEESGVAGEDELGGVLAGVGRGSAIGDDQRREGLDAKPQRGGEAGPLERVSGRCQHGGEHFAGSGAGESDEAAGRAPWRGSDGRDGVAGGHPP